MPAKKATAAASDTPAASQPPATAAEKAVPAKTAKKAAPTATAQEQPVRASSAPVEPDPDGAEAAESDTPLNRAERRAKGRGKNPSQVIGGRGKVSGGHGPAHTQRNWANRRSG